MATLLWPWAKCDFIAGLPRKQRRRMARA